MGCLQMFVRDHTAYNGFGGHDPNGKVASCISAPLDLEGAKANVSLNVGGVGANSRVSVEVLDVDFKALPGFSRTDCIHVDEQGLKQPVAWGDSTTIDLTRGIDGMAPPPLIRIKVNCKQQPPSRLSKNV